MDKCTVHGTKSDTGHHSLTLLLAGAFTGLLLGGLAAAGKLGSDRLSNSIVAEVNGAALSADEYHRSLRLFGSEKRGPVNDRDRALVLERMIEEELLLQHGVASGVMREHNRVREEALKSILAALLVELDSSAPESGARHTSVRAGDGNEDGAVSQPSAHDRLLAEYLDRLRATSTIRRTGVEPG